MCYWLRTIRWTSWEDENGNFYSAVLLIRSSLRSALRMEMKGRVGRHEGISCLAFCKWGQRWKSRNGTKVICNFHCCCQQLHHGEERNQFCKWGQQTPAENSSSLQDSLFPFPCNGRGSLPSFALPWDSSAALAAAGAQLLVYSLTENPWFGISDSHCHLNSF